MTVLGWIGIGLLASFGLALFVSALALAFSDQRGRHSGKRSTR